MSVSFRLYNNTSPGYTPLYPFKGLYHLNISNAYAADATLPNIVAGRVVEQWATLNPSPGVYNWSQLESDIAPWVAAGKKVILRIHTSQSAFVGAVTPSWVISSGVRTITETDGSTIPVRWDAAYGPAYQAFVQAFAAQYDGDPRVLVCQMGIGGNGDISIDNTSNTKPNKSALWNAVGYSDATWLAAILQIMGYYTAAFHRTPLTYTVLSSAFLGTTGSNGMSMATFLASAGLPAIPQAWPQCNSLSVAPQGIPSPVQAPPHQCLCLEQTTGTGNSGDSLLQDIQQGMQWGAQYIGLYPLDVESGDPSLAWANSKIGATW